MGLVCKIPGHVVGAGRLRRCGGRKAAWCDCSSSDADCSFAAVDCSVVAADCNFDRRRFLVADCSFVVVVAHHLWGTAVAVVGNLVGWADLLPVAHGISYGSQPPAGFVDDSSCKRRVALGLVSSFGVVEAAAVGTSC